VQYAVYDPATRELLCANAGLPRPIHISSSGCAEVGHGGLPSGLFDEALYEQCSVTLQPGDAMLFLTDGLIEAHDSLREEFGVPRVMEVCRRNHTSSAETLLDQLFEEVLRFTHNEVQQDDLTAALLKVR